MRKFRQRGLQKAKELVIYDVESYDDLIRMYAMSRILCQGQMPKWRQGRWGLSAMLRLRFCGERYDGRLDFQMLRFRIRRTESLLRLQLAQGNDAAGALRKRTKDGLKFFQKLRPRRKPTSYQLFYSRDAKDFPIYAFVFTTDVDWYQQIRHRPKNRFQWAGFDKKDWKKLPDASRIEAMLDKRHREFSRRIWGRTESR